MNLLPCRPSSDMSAYSLMRSPTPSAKHLISCLSCWASSPLLWTPLDCHTSPRACCLLVLSLQGRFLTPSLPMTLPEGLWLAYKSWSNPTPSLLCSIISLLPPPCSTCSSHSGVLANFFFFEWAKFFLISAYNSLPSTSHQSHHRLNKSSPPQPCHLYLASSRTQYCFFIDVTV